jgi:hypothetical protein
LGLKSGNIALCIQKIRMLKNTGDQMDTMELAEKKEAKHYRYGCWVYCHDAIVSRTFSLRKK